MLLCPAHINVLPMGGRHTLCFFTTFLAIWVCIHDEIAAFARIYTNMTNNHLNYFVNYYSWRTYTCFQLWYFITNSYVIYNVLPSLLWNLTIPRRPYMFGDFNVYLDLPSLNTRCWLTHLAHTKHLEDGPGTAITIRSTTSWWNGAFTQEWTLPGHKAFQEQISEVIMTCWWQPSTFAWRGSANQSQQESNLTLRNVRILM